MTGDTRLSKHFTLYELTRSQTAFRRGIDNTPPPEAYLSLVALCEHVLEPLRDLIGGPINVSSGYRSPVLNSLVGGAPESQHVLGEAADFTGWLRNTSIVSALQHSAIPYDQCILEFGDAGWVHVSYQTNPRRQLLTAWRDAAGKVRYAPLES